MEKFSRIVLYRRFVSRLNEVLLWSFCAVNVTLEISCAWVCNPMTGEGGRGDYYGCWWSCSGSNFTALHTLDASIHWPLL